MESPHGSVYFINEFEGYAEKKKKKKDISFNVVAL